MARNGSGQNDAAQSSKPQSATGSGKKLNILYMQLKTSSFAGIERVVDEICSELASAYGDEFDIDVFYPGQFNNHPIGDRGYNKIEIDTKGRIGFMRVTREIVSRKRYDLVVIPQVEPTVICWISCLGIPKKFVVYLHGNPKLETSHYKAKILFYLMKKIVLRRLSGVFGVSPTQIEAFKALYPSDVPHKWVPNPIRRFDPIETESDPNFVTFVNVARFSRQKGQDILVNAFAKLSRVRSNVKLRIVGYGNEEPDLRRTIKTLGLGDVVSLEHHPDNPQLPLASSDIYVSSSRWEGWPLVICEALRFGLPVVATDCEFGPGDILSDTRLGRLVPLGDEDELVNALIYYCDNLQAEKQHSAYRKAFIDQYSVEQVVHVHAAALRLAAGVSR